MRKNCPFCKKSIEKSASDCPYCKRVIIEHVVKIYETNNLHERNHQNTILQWIQKRIVHNLTWLGHNLTYIKKFFKPGIIFVIILIVVGLGKLNSDDTQQTRNYNNLPNGTVIHSIYKNGLGKLIIDNGTDFDAIAKLVNTNRQVSVFTVYIQSKSNYTVINVKDGTYDLYFHLGKDWDKLNNKFLVTPSYAKFRDSFSYTTFTTEEYDGIRTRYAEYQITLNPVVGGTAKTDDISEAEFLRY